VRVTVPVSVAYDLNKFKSTIGNLAAKLGCAACFSGANCTFHIERDYLLDAKLKVQSSAGLVRTVPDTAPAVSVGLSPNAANSLSQLQTAIGKIAKEMGCLSCTSGFDLNLRSEISQLTSRNFKVAANGALG